MPEGWHAASAQHVRRDGAQQRAGSQNKWTAAVCMRREATGTSLCARLGTHLEVNQDAKESGSQANDSAEWERKRARQRSCH